MKNTSNPPVPLKPDSEKSSNTYQHPLRNPWFWLIGSILSLAAGKLDIIELTVSYVMALCYLVIGLPITIVAVKRALH